MTTGTRSRRVRATLKVAAARSGGLGLLHRRRNRDRLTVATFHRVIAPGDPRWAQADPRYAVSDALFAECLAFFDRHFSVIGLGETRAALEGRPLPPRPLLVTLDDGWRDNVDHALPALRRAGLPALVFVVAGTIGADRPFWQERLYGAWRTGAAGDDRLDLLRARVGLAGAGPGGWTHESAIRDLVARLTELAPADRAHALDRAGLPEGAAGRAMMNAEELRRLAGGGVAIGAHGATHEPIPRAVDPADELVPPRSVLAGAIGRPMSEIDAMSFPHGRFDARTLRAAGDAGYRVVFTSETHLNECPRGLLGGPRIGRIGIPGPQITRPDGHLAPELLALWLFRRPARPAGSLPGPSRA